MTVSMLLVRISFMHFVLLVELVKTGKTSELFEFGFTIYLERNCSMVWNILNVALASINNLLSALRESALFLFTPI